MVSNSVEGILFVCLGNICRSPTAEAVVRAEFKRAGVGVPVASCGTGNWHLGEGADPRAVAAGAKAGYDLRPHRARQLVPDDFSHYQWVLGMDHSNLADMRKLCPPNLRDRVGLFMDVAEVAPPHEVPDPYHGSAADFAHVIDLVRRGAAGLIGKLQSA